MTETPTTSVGTDRQPLTEDYRERLQAMTLEEKVRVLTGASSFSLAPAESIGLQAINLSDGPGGVRGPEYPGGRAVTLFPSATLLGASWNEQTAYEVGALLAEEAKAQHVHVVLGPTINLHRSLLGGRVFEAYSEDPYLTGKLAAAYVRGLQDNGVGACLKHLVGNESETNRNTVDSVIDEKTLRELYLLPFQIAVEEADAWSIMAAYNDVNGTPSTEQHHVMNEVLKDEWGYVGLVMSDWFATKSTDASVMGGLDLVMPGPAGPWGRALIDAVCSGRVPESVVDSHVARVIQLGERTGAFRNHPGDRGRTPAPDSPTRRDQLTRIAAGAMTVLRNDEGTLPLRRDQRVALIGRHALETIGMGGGSAQVTPPYQVSVADGFTEAGLVSLTVTDGVPVRVKATDVALPHMAQPSTSAPGMDVTFLSQDGATLAERRSERPMTYIDIADVFEDYVHRIVMRTRTDVTGTAEVGVIGAGHWTIVSGDARVTATLTPAGIGYGEKILAPQATTIEIEVAPSGIVEATLVPTHPMGMKRSDKNEDLPDARLLLEGAGAYGLTVMPAPRPTGEILADAAAAARDADVAVVVVGTTDEQESEAVDKTTLRLPGEQDALVSAVAQAARRTVVVVNAGTPMLMPWRDEVDAIVVAGIAGQEVGRAVAAALLGDIEPSGRLASSVPVADGAAPAWNVTPIDGAIVYEEGTRIGYRGHDAGLAPAPAYWFGHGLGYSTWDYSEAKPLPAGRSGISVQLRNTGERTSREVVQLYFRPVEADEPVRLVGWTAITLTPEESSTVEVEASPRMMQRWDEVDGWVLLTGGGRFIIARGLGDVRAEVELRQGRHA
jgi:beta-glucosidase